MRVPADTLVDCELTWLDREPIDVSRARDQHSAYCDVLRKLGLDVEVLPPDDRYPDSTFVEDAALILDEVAVLTRPGAGSRRGEPALLEATLARHRPVVRMVQGQLDGGDVIRAGRRLFVGVGSRTDGTGLAALQGAAGPGYEVVGVDFQGCLHLKSAATMLDDEVVLLNPDWVNPNRFPALRALAVDPAEPWAADVLRVHDTVLMNAACPRTMALVRARGYRVEAINVSEFMKAEAAITCLSLIV